MNKIPISTKAPPAARAAPLLLESDELRVLEGPLRLSFEAMCGVMRPRFVPPLTVRAGRLGAGRVGEQHRRLAGRQVGVVLDGAHLQGVEQLDARDRDARLDGHDGSVAACLDRGERAGAP